ncbi:MAG: Mobile element protein [uncultured Paraburkholderia sp.]|nr:MAG: Mobile element protein [uncultured Paraburkholderia sp.]CAH2945813.1 MAG: Mobile element protein [uncultured Paraburkholderia sp.]
MIAPDVPLENLRKLSERTGLPLSAQVVPKRIEEHFGWAKTVGRIRQTVYRGIKRVDQHFKLTMTASNLTRMARIYWQRCRKERCNEPRWRAGQRGWQTTWRTSDLTANCTCNLFKQCSVIHDHALFNSLLKPNLYARNHAMRLSSRRDMTLTSPLSGFAEAIHRMY